jgi:hypothetical protein
MKRLWIAAALAIALMGIAAGPAAAKPGDGLWDLYRGGLRTAKYIDLSHKLTPQIPVWQGFGSSFFSPAVNPETGQPYTYAPGADSVDRHPAPALTPA